MATADNRCARATYQWPLVEVAVPKLALPMTTPSIFTTTVEPARIRYFTPLELVPFIAISVTRSPRSSSIRANLKGDLVVGVHARGIDRNFQIGMMLSRAHARR
jgi:hypothetical protein